MNVHQLSSIHRRRRAFSALEMIAAILIISIMSVIGYVGARSIGAMDQVRETARRLTHACSTARAMAIANNSTYTVRVDLTHKNFWIDETTLYGDPVAAKVVRPEKFAEHVLVNEFLYGSTAANNADIRTIRMFADGSSDDVSIMLVRDGDNAADPTKITTVRVYGPTGQCRIFENQRLEPTMTPLQ